MRPIAAVDDQISGGIHCHGGHDHPPPPTPGTIVTGSSKVFVRGRPIARVGDKGHSSLCCIGIGEIVLLQDQGKVYVDGQPAVGLGSPTQHCGMAPGQIVSGEPGVRIS